MSIIKATRANYAALQHKPDGHRKPLDAEVNEGGTVHRWRFWVIADTPAQRKREIARAFNRLCAMYPYARSVSVEFFPV